MKFSIIIPVKELNSYIEESLDFINKLNHKDFEVLIFPDSAERNSYKGAKIISTGSISPPKKRDLALKYAKGEIIAFLDDDAYPRGDWLNNATKFFKDKNVAAVCGPAITPSDDSVLQKASGLVFCSKIVSGKYVYRYKPAKSEFEVDDYPSVNFLIRKDIFKKLGGFKTNYWPGEDTKLCLDIINRLNNKIIYSPEVLVYHHRRSGVLKHIKQVWNYGFHRAFFARKFPETSLKIEYFIPALFAIGIVFGLVLTFLSKTFLFLYLAGILSYLLIVFCFMVYEGISQKAIISTPVAFLLVPLTHFFYGLGFIDGIFVKKIKR